MEFIPFCPSLIFHWSCQCSRKKKKKKTLKRCSLLFRLLFLHHACWPANQDSNSTALMQSHYELQINMQQTYCEWDRLISHVHCWLGSSLVVLDLQNEFNDLMKLTCLKGLDCNWGKVQVGLHFSLNKPCLDCAELNLEITGLSSTDVSFVMWQPLYFEVTSPLSPHADESMFQAPNLSIIHQVNEKAAHSCHLFSITDRWVLGLAVQ